VAFLFNPATAPYAPIYLDPFKSAAASLKVEGIATPVHDTSGMKSAIAALGGGGLIVLPSFFMTAHRDLIIAEAVRHRVPAIYPFRHFAISASRCSVVQRRWRRARFLASARGSSKRPLRGASPGCPQLAKARVRRILVLTQTGL
jgi:putative ABC transport system substrate-binding protein